MRSAAGVGAVLRRHREAFPAGQSGRGLVGHRTSDLRPREESQLQRQTRGNEPDVHPRPPPPPCRPALDSFVFLTPGAADPAESEDQGGGGEEGPGVHGAQEEVHDKQREEEEPLQDAEEGEQTQKQSDRNHETGGGRSHFCRKKMFLALIDLNKLTEATAS